MQVPKRSPGRIAENYPKTKTAYNNFVPNGREQKKLRYFRNPCDRDPPTRNFKNFKFFQSTLKILNVYFWGKERLLLGNERLLLGNERLLLGIIGVFGFFGISFLLLGGFGSPWVGGPVGVFENI